MSRMLNTLSTTSEMTLSNPNCVPLIQNSCTDHKYLMEEPHIPLFTTASEHCKLPLHNPEIFLVTVSPVCISGLQSSLTERRHCTCTGYLADLVCRHLRTWATALIHSTWARRDTTAANDQHRLRLTTYVTALTDTKHFLLEPITSCSATLFSSCCFPV
jgi:hypothetical protein